MLRNSVIDRKFSLHTNNVKNIFILYNSKIRIDFQLHKEVNCQKYCP